MGRLQELLDWRRGDRAAMVYMAAGELRRTHQLWTLQSVCRALVALLSHPEADSPLNCDCGNLIRNGDMRGYRSMARMYTNLHAAPEGAR